MFKMTGHTNLSHLMLQKWYMKQKYLFSGALYIIWSFKNVIFHWHRPWHRLLRPLFEPQSRLCRHIETWFWAPAKTFITCIDTCETPSETFSACRDTGLNPCWDFLGMLEPRFELMSRLSQHVNKTLVWTPIEPFSACREPV